MNAILVLFPVTRGARGGRKRRNSSPDGDRIIGYCYLSPEEPGGGATVRMVAGSLDTVTCYQGSHEGQE